MALDLTMPQPPAELKPRIVVIGVGGAGGNAVNNMIRAELEGVEFIVANTDAQALAQSAAQCRIQLGAQLTRGLGAGAKPDKGRDAAEEALEDVLAHLNGANMLFITAGMGGGTGTGAAPVIAQAAREAGILTVGVVTKPFHFEGAQRMRIAEDGIRELQNFVDTLIVIPNQNLFRIANEKTTFADAFKLADDVLYSGVRGVTDLMVMPGLINLDFADIRTVMGEMGKAMMGTGEMEGENRAVAAAEAAISNPLLDNVSMKGARGILISITGGPDLTLYEVDEAANRIREEVDPDANIIFGSTYDPTLEGRIRISVVATGIDSTLVMPGNNGGDRGRTRPEADPQGKPVAPEMPEMPRHATQAVAAEPRPAGGTLFDLPPQRPVRSVETPADAPRSFMPPLAAEPADMEKPVSPQERQIQLLPGGTARPLDSRLEGFFQRMGRRATEAEERQDPSFLPGREQADRASAADARDQRPPVPEAERNLDSEEMTLEIPTFLRRQAN